MSLEAAGGNALGTRTLGVDRRAARSSAPGCLPRGLSRLLREERVTPAEQE